MTLRCNIRFTRSGDSSVSQGRPGACGSSGAQVSPTRQRVTGRFSCCPPRPVLTRERNNALRLCSQLPAQWARQQHGDAAVGHLDRDLLCSPPCCCRGPTWPSPNVRLEPVVVVSQDRAACRPHAALGAPHFRTGRRWGCRGQGRQAEAQVLQGIYVFRVRTRRISVQEIGVQVEILRIGTMLDVR